MSSRAAFRIAAAAQQLLVWLCVVPSAFSAEPGTLTHYPKSIELGASAQQHGLIILATDEGGNTRDVTKLAKLTAGSTHVEINGAEVIALATGATSISAEFEGKSVTIPVKVGELTAVVPSFVHDVEPLLTRSGCNTGSCHGKMAGMNGFKLSLRGYAPEWDHAWLTQELAGRRVNYAFPDQSVLVQKPTGGLLHEGGTKFRRGSRASEVLVDWIAARAPGPNPDEPALERLEVLPGGRQLRTGETQQLLARAHYADGRVRDVTWLAQFFSNDEGLLTIDEHGTVTAQRFGEASVRVHFQGLVEVLSFSMPFEHEVDDKEFTEHWNAIDSPLFAKLRALNIPPSASCSDAEFLRRAFLDTIGTLPTAGDVDRFVADADSDKRAKLVDALLERPEWVDFWTLQLADVLQNRRERDNDHRGAKGVRALHAWLRLQLARNRSWAEIASDVILARGHVDQNPQTGYYFTVLGRHKLEDSQLADAVAQSFLGTRIGCAKCHNHPLEKYTQDDYYHFLACFSQVSLDRIKPEEGGSEVHVLTRDQFGSHRRIRQLEQRIGEAKDDEQRAKEVESKEREEKRFAEILQQLPTVHQPRTKQQMPPQTLDRVALKFEAGDDPRQPFVDWMLQSEDFAGAMVNRVWAHFFQVGIVDPVDDLRASNPPSNTELFAVLKQEFAAADFDLKSLMRLVLTSRAYSLSSSTQPRNATDARHYSHYYAKRLSAEVLADALAMSTGFPNRFEGYPLGVRAIQIPEPEVSSYFLTTFGKSERVTACACEREGEVTLPQLLHLQNADELLGRLSQDGGQLATLLQEPDNAIALHQLYRATIGRSPLESETAVIHKLLAESPRGEVFRDVFWALLNSKEFAFNH
ncbi:MAG: hypothetical protein ACI8UO_003966 [Verrucomicrobiales bacterium]|jgi:hypothetical protein